MEGPYFPAEQYEHAALPVVDAYLPCVQSTHSARLGAPEVELCLPTGQLMQTVLLDAPMEEEYLPELQSVQVVVLVKGEYFPA